MYNTADIMNANEQIIKILKKIDKTKVIDLIDLKSLSLEEQELIKNLYKDGLIKDALSFIDTINTENSWEAFKKKLYSKNRSTKPLWRKVYKYAAIFVLLLTCGFLLKNKFKTEDNEVKIASGSIELILENGEKKILNLGGTTEIVKESGNVIGQHKGDAINYESNSAVKKIVYNQLRIPYGKTFNLFLSDGTKVYLNSGTSLKYPINFIKGKKREVFLEGEAFFEVAKDASHPFIVNTNNMNIEVLGTKFNVSSYSDDTETNTVLIEGSVSLSLDKTPEETLLLKPGYKGTLNNSESQIALEKVDTQMYTEWIHGDVIFRNSTFDDMIKKLERNYNVIIENNYSELSLKKFNASFNKNIETIDDIMISIGEIHPFTYKKIDNKIIINK